MEAKASPYLIKNSTLMRARARTQMHTTEGRHENKLSRREANMPQPKRLHYNEGQCRAQNLKKKKKKNTPNLSEKERKKWNMISIMHLKRFHRANNFVCRIIACLPFKLKAKQLFKAAKTGCGVDNRR